MHSGHAACPAAVPGSGSGGQQVMQRAIQPFQQLLQGHETMMAKHLDIMQLAFQRVLGASKGRHKMAQRMLAAVNGTITSLS